MEKQKYVKLKNDEVIIFPCVIEHSTFRGLEPVNAGFCYVNPVMKRIDCFGESVSLRLKSDKRNDTLYATKQVFGVDRMLEMINGGEELTS